MPSKPQRQSYGSLSLSLSDTDTNIWSNMIAIFKSPILSIFVFFEISKQRSCRVPPGGKKKNSKTAILTGLKGVSPLSFPNFHSVAIIMLTLITNTGQQYCPLINGFDSSSYCTLIMFRKILLNLQSGREQMSNWCILAEFQISRSEGKEQPRDYTQYTQMKAISTLHT